MKSPQTSFEQNLHRAIKNSSDELRISERVVTGALISPKNWDNYNIEDIRQRIDVLKVVMRAKIRLLETWEQAKEDPEFLELIEKQIEDVCERVVKTEVFQLNDLMPIALSFILFLRSVTISDSNEFEYFMRICFGLLSYFLGYIAVKDFNRKRKAYTEIKKLKAAYENLQHQRISHESRSKILLQIDTLLGKTLSEEIFRKAIAEYPQKKD